MFRIFEYSVSLHSPVLRIAMLRRYSMIEIQLGNGLQAMQKDSFSPEKDFA